MGRLFHLKSWFEVSEAAGYVSTLLDEPVASTDLLRLAMERHLTLSVHLVNHAIGLPGRIVALDEAGWETVPDLTGAGEIRLVKGTVLPGDRVIVWSDQVQTLTGVWDLPMLGAETIDVEHAYQRRMMGPEVELCSLEGVFVTNEAGAVHKLMSRFDTKECPSLGKAEPHYRAENYYPRGSLPEDAVLVVRKAAIYDFIERHGARDSPLVRPLERRERTTLLILIKALADIAKVDVSKPSSAAAAIETQTALLGARVAARTIEGHLNRIPEALESRA